MFSTFWFVFDARRADVDFRSYVRVLYAVRCRFKINGARDTTCAPPLLVSFVGDFRCLLLIDGCLPPSSIQYRLRKRVNLFKITKNGDYLTPFSSVAVCHVNTRLTLKSHAFRKLKCIKLANVKRPLQRRQPALRQCSDVRYRQHNIDEELSVSFTYSFLELQKVNLFFLLRLLNSIDIIHVFLLMILKGSHIFTVKYSPVLKNALALFLRVWKIGA